MSFAAPLLTVLAAQAADPQLALLTPPQVGQTLTYELSGTLAGPGVPEFLLIDFSILPFPIDLVPLGPLHLTLSPQLIILVGDGSHIWNVPVPGDPVLTGVAVHSQGLGFVFDGASGVQRFSNLVSVVLTDPDPVPRFAFVANELDDSISQLLVTPATGKLRHAGYRLVGDRPIDVEAARDSLIYVLCAGADEIQGFAVGPVDGDLAPLPTTALGAGSDPRDLVVDPAGNFLYASDGAGDAIHAFSIAGNGDLVPVTGSPFAVNGSGSGNQGTTGLAIDEQTRFLFATNRQSATLSVFNLDPTGALSGEQTGNTGPQPVAVTAIYQADPEPRAVVACAGNGSVNSYRLDALGDPTVAGFASLGGGANPLAVTAGSFGGVDAAFVSCEGIDVIARLPLTALGALDAPIVDLAGAGPRSVVLADDSGFAVAIYGNGNELSSATIDPATGDLTPIAPTSSPTDRIRVRSGPRSIALVRGLGGAEFESDSLYAASREGFELSQFSIDATAPIVAPLLPAAVPTAGQPNDVAVHPRQNLAFVANFLQSGGADLEVYDLSANGSATLTQTIDVGAAGESRQWTVDVDPGGLLVLAIEQLAGEVIPLTIGPGGVLTPGTSAGTGTVPRGAAVDPTGRFYYVANSLDNTLSQFALEPLAGALQPLTPPQVGAGQGPVAVAVDPTGRFLFAANLGSDSISGYSIDATDGSLTELSTSPFAAGQSPAALAIDPAGRFLICANEVDRSLSRFALNLDSMDGVADGTLVPLGAVPVLDLPRGLAFDGSGKLLLVSLDVTTVGSGASDRIATYNFDATAGGALTLVDQDPSGSGPRGIATRDRVR